jgi:hypothetical protein
MSDHIVHIVDLTSTGAAAERVGDVVRQWLIDERVIRATTASGGPHPGGERWHTAVAGSGPHEPPGYSGIEIRVGRELYDSGEAWQPLVCAACGHSPQVRSAEQADAVMEVNEQLANAWQKGGEPTATCPACGETRLLGDWGGVSCAVGEVGVSVVNWSELDPAFVARVRERMGARTVVLEEHS